MYKHFSQIAIIQHPAKYADVHFLKSLQDWSSLRKFVKISEKFMKHILFLPLLLITACTSPNRNAEWLQQAETHWKSGQTDSTLTYLYKINEEKLSGKEKYDYYRLKYSSAFSNEPEANRQMEQATAWYEETNDTNNLTVMRSVLFQHYRYENQCERADSVLRLMKQCYEERNDSMGFVQIYSMKALLFEQLGMTDSALYYMDKRIARERTKPQVRYRYVRKSDILSGAGNYDEAETYLDSAKAIATDVGDRDLLYHLTERYRRLYTRQERYADLMCLLQDSRQYMKRSDVASHNLYKAHLHEQLHSEDSALYYYRLVAESENLFLASEALYHLSQYYLTGDDTERAYHYHRDATGYTNQVFGAYRSQARNNAFNELKLQSEIDSLKIGRQRQIILILSLLLLLVGFAATIGLLLQTRKRKEMETQQVQMEQENRLLRKSEELAQMREKANLLRERLIRKMEVFQKLPSLNEELQVNDRAIALSEREWREIRALLDAEYDRFTVRLHQAVPDLTTTDIDFCCLLKINVGMADLANIYCINKASVSRRKQRMKEKIGDELLQGLTLDDFLQRF